MVDMLVYLVVLYTTINLRTCSIPGLTPMAIFVNTCNNDNMQVWKLYMNLYWHALGLYF